jgi:hypothetical protein
VDEFALPTELAVGADRQPRSLGMWAVLTGVVTPEQLQEAYARWDERGEAPAEMFVRNGWMTEETVADVLSELSGLPVVRTAQRSEDPDVLGALSADEAWRLEACPLERDDDGNLVVALADPSDARLRALQAQLGSNIRPVIVMNSQLKELLDGAQATGSSTADDDPPPSLPSVVEDGGEPDADAFEAVPRPQVATTDRPDDAPERVDGVPLTFEPGDDPGTAADQLKRLHERLVSEHVQATDELVAYRRQFRELAEEQARIQRSMTALEAKLGEDELVLSLITANLKELKQTPPA